jgi:hypothetical protein
MDRQRDRAALQGQALGSTTPTDRSAELAMRGFVNERGATFSAASIKSMIEA